MNTQYASVADEVRAIFTNQKSSKEIARLQKEDQRRQIKEALSACRDLYGRHPTIDSIAESLMRESAEMYDENDDESPLELTWDEAFEDAERIWEEIQKIKTMKPGPNFEYPECPL